MRRPYDDDMDVPEVRESGMLDVGDGQTLYWEEVGEPQGRPAVWLHGGPGSGITPGHRRLVSRPGWRGVLFDQRGAGRSLPSAADPNTDLSVITTEKMIQDIEALRIASGVDTWTVVGGSWGCTLGLAYAIAHPERVDGLCLLSVTTGAHEEVEWITRGVGAIFPEAWDEFVGHLPPDERDGNIPAAYARLLGSAKSTVRAAAAAAWCRWEDTHVSLAPGWTHWDRYDDPDFAFAFARQVTHSWANGSFLPDRWVLDHAGEVGCPVEMIHGRHDVSGPVGIPWKLLKALPDGRLAVAEGAGHSGAGTAEFVAAAMDRLLAAPRARGGT